MKREISLAGLNKFWTPSVFKNIQESGIFREEIFTEKMTTLFTVFDSLIQESIMEKGILFNVLQPMKNSLNMGGFSISNLKWKSLHNSPLTNGVFRDTCMSIKTSTQTVKLSGNDVDVIVPSKADTTCILSVVKNVNTLNIGVSSKIDFDSFVGKNVLLKMSDFSIPKSLGIPSGIIYGTGHVAEVVGIGSWIVPCTVEIVGNNANMKINLQDIKVNTSDLFLCTSNFVTSTTVPF